MKSICADLGGTSVKLAIVDSGKVLKRGVVPTSIDINDTLKAMEIGIKELCNGENVTGLGIAFAGPCDPKGKKFKKSNGKHLNAENVDIKAWSKSKLGIDNIQVENDANAALLGELCYGVGKNANDAIIMIVGTGIGGAAMINGKLIRGKHDQAGNMSGHISIMPDGRQCTCPNKGCVEAYAASWSLPITAKEHKDFNNSILSKVENIDFFELTKAVRANDQVAKDVLDFCCKCWGTGIVNMIHAYDPEVVILSGGPFRSADLIVPKVKEYVLAHAWTLWGKVDIRVSENPADSVILGMHALLEADGKY